MKQIMEKEFTDGNCGYQIVSCESKHDEDYDFLLIFSKIQFPKIGSLNTLEYRKYVRVKVVNTGYQNECAHAILREFIKTNFSTGKDWKTVELLKDNEYFEIEKKIVYKIGENYENQ